MHENRRTDTRSATGSWGGAPFAAVAVMAEEPRMLAKRNRSETRELPFHATCEDVFPGILRGKCTISNSGWAVFLRVRTLDDAPDIAAIAEASRESRVPITTRGATGNGTALVTLRQVAARGDCFYEVSMRGAERGKLRNAMKKVDAVALELVISKEIAQNLIGGDITEFMREMMGEAVQMPERRPAAGMSAADILKQMDLDARVVPGPEGAR